MPWLASLVISLYLVLFWVTSDLRTQNKELRFQLDQVKELVEAEHAAFIRSQESCTLVSNEEMK